MTDDAIRAAVESADTYKAAAAALGMDYQKLYTAAHRLRVKPKRSVDIERRRHPAPRPGAPTLHDAIRPPAPEPTKPVLGPWIPPWGLATKPDVVGVRLDQERRVRAEVSKLSGEGWYGWTIHDVTGAVTGKLGICGSLSIAEGRRKAEDGADEALVRLGWLPKGHAPATMLCDVAVPVCGSPKPEPPPVPVDPVVALAERVLAASPSQRAGLAVELARLVMAAAQEGRAA